MIAETLPLPCDPDCRLTTNAPEHTPIVLEDLHANQAI
jgi:hypothetical protein